MDASLEYSALAGFEKSFGGHPTFLAQSPGRVELLGNHTDYNGGLVLAAAIDRFTIVVGRPRPDREARVRSVNMNETIRFPIDALERGEAGSWDRYARGVVWAMQEAMGRISSGFDSTIAGDVPLGAGLSSSASLQGALALFLLQIGLGGQGASPELNDPARMALAKVLRRSENEFVGVASGLLDQFSTLFGLADHALSLDCLTLDYERLPLGRPAPAIIVCDSKTSRRLADGMYNQRRAECERVVSWFQARKGVEAVRLLRDVSLDELRGAWDELDPVGRRRALHVLTENDRVRRGAEALRAGDIATFGALMSASHASSRDDFDNSSPALNALVESAEACSGFLGGKLSGAGWAGCTVNLVQSDRSDAFSHAIRVEYKKRTGIVPDVHVCQSADGAFARGLGGG